jgi:lactoylglutathione lyase
MIQKIATVAVYVDDQEAAMKFWTEQVGFELRTNQPMGPNGSWIEVAPQGAESCLVLYPKSMMSNHAERKPSIVFVTEDIHKTYEAMKEKGVTFKQEPNEMPWGTFAIFLDNEGNEYVLKS